jgi:hypothetical protein
MALLAPQLEQLADVATEMMSVTRLSVIERATLRIVASRSRKLSQELRTVRDPLLLAASYREIAGFVDVLERDGKRIDFPLSDSLAESIRTSLEVKPLPYGR